MWITLLGEPGVGKTTLGQHLEAAGIATYISGSALLERYISEKREGWEQIKVEKDAGNLADPDFTHRLLAERIASVDTNEFIVLDGFPKTSGEIERTEALLPAGSIDLALLLECLPAIRDLRVSRRCRCGECSLVTSRELPPPCEHVSDGLNLKQREDDKPGAMKRRRLHEPVEKLAKPFEESSRLVRINSEGTPEEVFEVAFEVLRSSS